MKKSLLLVLALLAVYFAVQPLSSVDQPSPVTQPSNAALERAISARLAGYQVSGSGEVARLLSDDDDGSRHQRFILQLQSGRTLLIAHNIDLAPRISDLRPGETVSFFGEYEWNVRGGVIHWTHHDPRAQHIDGWIEYRGNRYQ